MTNEEIDATAAGRELDVLVAERVMGWHYIQHIDTFDDLFGMTTRTTRRLVPDDIQAEPRMADMAYPSLPHYSTNIADAWKIINHLLNFHWDYEIRGLSYLDNMVAALRM